MPQQIRFFNKNKIDLDNENVTITVTDSVATNSGQDFVDFVRNRNNTSAWATTGSADAGNTTLEINMVDERDISDIILIGHNLKAFTIQYFDGLVYQDFSTAIAETTNSDENSYFQFTKVSTTKVKIVITGTQVADDEKFIKQIILSDRVGQGQFVGWPELKNPKHSTNKKINTMLSGKANVVESVGSFSTEMSVRNWNSDEDLSIVEEIYFGKRAVLVWLSGGDETQFSTQRIGYRNEDIYLMRCINDYEPEWYKGLYKTGLKINMRMREAIG